MGALWHEDLFRNIVLSLTAGISLLAVIFFLVRKKNAHTMAAWASLQSWLFGLPVVLVIIAADKPLSMYGLIFLSIIATKEFFQITGMYHQSLFVWLTYGALLALGVCIHNQSTELFNLMPMLFLGVISTIPILKNSAKHMLQYIALSLIAFTFIGWSFLHSARILQWEGGAYVFIYAVVLSEISDNMALAISRFWGHRKVASNITPHRTFEGFVVSTLATLTLGYALRPILPHSLSETWIWISLIPILAGGLGDLVLSVFRKDVGARDSGAFILGRSGVLDRLDRMIFVAPILYYTVKGLSH